MTIVHMSGQVSSNIIKCQLASCKKNKSDSSCSRSHCLRNSGKSSLPTSNRRREKSEKSSRSINFSTWKRSKDWHTRFPFSSRNWLYITLSSRFGGLTVEEPWQVLGNRYQLLSLLGKGGFSEVYKVIPPSIIPSYLGLNPFRLCCVYQYLPPNNTFTLASFSLTLLFFMFY